MSETTYIRLDYRIELDAYIVSMSPEDMEYETRQFDCGSHSELARIAAIRYACDLTERRIKSGDRHAHFVIRPGAEQ